jgi:hypothetical protein
MAEEGCGDYHFWCGDADNKIMISKSDDKFVVRTYSGEEYSQRCWKLEISGTLQVGPCYHPAETARRRHGMASNGKGATDGNCIYNP